jgi:hypothetical protein
MSVFVEKAIAEAGLAGVLDARRLGPLADSDVARLRDADLLVLGALADHIRSKEVGPIVRIFTSDVPETGSPRSLRVLPSPGQSGLTGLELLREVAVARVTLPPGTRIRVDFDACGLEIAQIALGFGADELGGHVANKRGLPFAEGELAGVGKKSRLESAVVVKEREIAGFVVRAGRTPEFVRGDVPLSALSVQAPQASGLPSEEAT